MAKNQPARSLILLGAALFATAAAQAQTRRDKAATGDAADGGIAEIVVTAQKREQRLIDIPLSVSVLSADDLTRSGSSQFRDFADSVPGLNFTTTGAGNTQTTLRGVTVGYDVSPTVGLYIDEAPFGSSTVFNFGAQFSFDAALFDVDRIEILRGPQGTLYGASAMGGLIRYISPRPDPTAFHGRVLAGVSAAEHGGVGYNVAGAVNVPIVEDKVALRASAFEAHDGGFIDNVARGSKNVNRSDVYGGRLDLLMQPTETLSVRLSALLQKISRDGEGTSDYLPSGVPAYGDLKQFRKIAEPFDQNFKLFSGTITNDFGGVELTSISTYQRQKVVNIWDISANYVPILNLFGGPYGSVALTNALRTNKFVQEVRLASNRKHSPLEWVIGGYLNREDSNIEEEFVPRDLAGNLAPSIFFIYRVPSKFKENAVFGNATFSITDKLSLTGGLRYAQNRQVFTQIATGIFTGNVPTIKTKDSVVTYLANVKYQFDSHSTAYARYATGYRPGGPNIATNAGGGGGLTSPTFDPDTLKSYEIGLKMETDDRRYGFDAAVYYIDWKNIQIAALRGGFTTYINATEGAEIRGTELNLTARPVSGLLLTGALSYQDAKMSAADPDLLNRKGERLPNVPHFSASMNADYSFQNGGSNPSIGGSIRYVGGRYTSFDNSTSYPQFRLPSYMTVDLRAGITIANADVQIFARNIFDKRGLQSIVYPQFGYRVAVVPPRTIGFSVSGKF